VCSNFSCVHPSHDLCERVHTHSLEGTLLKTHPKYTTSIGNQSGSNPLVLTFDLALKDSSCSMRLALSCLRTWAIFTHMIHDMASTPAAHFFRRYSVYSLCWRYIR